MNRDFDRIFSNPAALYGFGAVTVIFLLASAIADLWTGVFRGIILLLISVLFIVCIILKLKDSRRNLASCCSSLMTLIFAYNLTNLYVTAISPEYIFMGGFGKFVLMLFLILSAVAALVLWLAVVFPTLYGNAFRAKASYISIMYLTLAVLPVLLVRAIGMGLTFAEVMSLLATMTAMPVFACLLNVK